MPTRRARLRRTRRIAFVTAIALWVGHGFGSAAAQTPTAATLKAAFLHNFAKFTEWPADALAPGQALALCVLGDASVASALTRVAAGQQLGGHEIVVRAVDGDGPIRSCHLLYANRSQTAPAAKFLETLNGAAIFTVGDHDRFAESGGVAQLILEGDRMRFAVNVTSAQRARLTLSSRLLSLARIVKDGPDVRR